MSDDFQFKSPPEAPVFEPTEEEFKDPIEYIAKIRPQAIKTGICKIRPPKNWQPPFAVDIQTFKFKARVQRLYELEAQSRIKYNFILKLSQFLKLQGREKLRIPNLCGRFLDLHKLKKIVDEEGGYDEVMSNRKWGRIAERLGYQAGRVSHQLKMHYEKILLPYVAMLSGAAQNPQNRKNTVYVKQEKNSLTKTATIKRQRKSIVTDVSEIDYSANKEMKKLQFYGPGPKAAVPDQGVKQEDTATNTVMENEDSIKNTEVQNTLKRKALDDFICNACRSGQDEDQLLICDTEGCDESYHTYCLMPQLTSVPKEVWKCPPCVVKTCQKPPEEFGFQESLDCYTLEEFGQRADQFKADYFKKAAYEVTCKEVEHEFWRILQSFNDEVVVEYGADIHSSKWGSGFPTPQALADWKVRLGKVDVAKKYADSPWNLNVLPVLERSVLRHIKANISGMKIPWCYVGMMFSCFCWHIEDHWSYSINYMHWGEPKTWYGVSGLEADKFEQAMRRQAPELFENAPDLLHHITTIMNPNILQKEGISVVRTDQHAGEFMITFPRAYHAGFNQGFNFAEAVNFCPADWLPSGRACINHYAELHHSCVFSHEELLCCMTENVRDKLTELDSHTILVLRNELRMMIEKEKQLRNSVHKLGVTTVTQVNFEDLTDDDRVCQICMTTCFLSALTCPCPKKIVADGPLNSAEIDAKDVKKEEEKERMVCLQHAEDLCSCNWSTRVIKYRYTVGELYALLEVLDGHSVEFREWKLAVPEGIRSAAPSRVVEVIDEVKETELMDVDKHEHQGWTLEQLKAHLAKGREFAFQSTELYRSLNDLITECESLVKLMDVILSDTLSLDYEFFLRVRSELGSHHMIKLDLRKMTVSTLQDVVLRLKSLPFPEIVSPTQLGSLEALVARIPQWQAEVDQLVALPHGQDCARVEELCQEAVSFRIPVPEFELLVKLDKRLNWLKQTVLWFPDLGEEENGSLTKLEHDEEQVIGSPSGDRKLRVRRVRPAVKDLDVLINLGLELCAETEPKLRSLVGRLEARVGALQSRMHRVTRLAAEITTLTQSRNFDLDEILGLCADSQAIDMFIPELSELKKACWESWTEQSNRVNSDNKYTFAPASLEWFEKLYKYGKLLCSEGLIKRSQTKYMTSFKAVFDMTRLSNQFRNKVAAEFLFDFGSQLDETKDTRLLKVLLPRVFSSANVVGDTVSEFIKAVKRAELETSSDAAAFRIQKAYDDLSDAELRTLCIFSTQNSADSQEACYLCQHQLPTEDVTESNTNVGLCRECKRTKRPTLSTLKQLGAQFTTITLRTYEEAALMGLIKRTVRWLEKMEQMISSHSCLTRLIEVLQDRGVCSMPCGLKISVSPTSHTCSDSGEGHESPLPDIDKLWREGLLIEVELSPYLTLLKAIEKELCLSEKDSSEQPEKESSLCPSSDPLISV